MIANNIQIILFITGGVTATMLIQFLAPAFSLRAMNSLILEDEKGLFFARQLGLLTALTGGLLIWAGLHPELRAPVILFAALGKGVFVFQILRNFRAFTKGYLLTAIFDSVCVLLYALYLLGL